ncbi:MAG: TVP38/TMEM64 family protein [Tyzzerella sp.]|nr:TVP38/TMEM64 family protein [Tyzzerella sp.]
MRWVMKKFIKYGSIVGIIAAIVFIIICFQKQVFVSPETLQEYLMQFGLWAPLLFMVIQITQVIFPIIPGGITCVAGVICFGPVWGFVYNYISICIGSCFNFLLIRKYGKPLLVQLSSQKVYDKYVGWLDKGERFDKLFAIAIFLPVAPDDFLCMLAGLTKMTFQKFVMIITLCKPCSILLYSMGLTTILTQFATLFMK